MTIKSIDFFSKFGSEIQVGHSKITLSMLYAWSGNLSDGLKEIEEAESILFGKTLERHIIFNNKAAIFMYQGHFNDDVEDLLNEARTTALTPFEKLAIFINMLILFQKRRYYDKCEIVTSNIIDLVKIEKDIIMHRLAFYHISLAYKNYNQNLSSYYWNKTIETHNLITQDDYSEYWSLRLQLQRDEATIPLQYSFLLKYEFESCFISYWHFEIPKEFN